MSEHKEVTEEIADSYERTRGQRTSREEIEAVLEHINKNHIEDIFRGLKVRELGFELNSRHFEEYNDELLEIHERGRRLRRDHYAALWSGEITLEELNRRPGKAETQDS